MIGYAFLLIFSNIPLISQEIRKCDNLDMITAEFRINTVKSVCNIEITIIIYISHQESAIVSIPMFLIMSSHVCIDKTLLANNHKMLRPKNLCILSIIFDETFKVSFLPLSIFFFKNDKKRNQIYSLFTLYLCVS